MTFHFNYLLENNILDKNCVNILVEINDEYKQTFFIFNDKFWQNIYNKSLNNI